VCVCVCVCVCVLCASISCIFVHITDANASLKKIAREASSFREK